MKVELWSDIACPYCYIAKRQYEAALSRFPYAEEVKLEWKSYLLEADTSGRPMNETLARKITALAESVGLTYRMGAVVAADTLKAHQLSHLAKSKGCDAQNRMEEELFNAYFVEGRDLNDLRVLLALANKAGLPEEEARRVFDEQRYIAEIHAEMKAAQEMELDYIPYFRFNESHVISGVQSEKRYLDTLERAYGEWKNGETPISPDHYEGKSCSIDGHCE